MRARVCVRVYVWVCVRVHVCVRVRTTWESTGDETCDLCRAGPYQNELWLDRKARRRDVLLAVLKR